jgi:hypothetical protein
VQSRDDEEAQTDRNKGWTSRELLISKIGRQIMQSCCTAWESLKSQYNEFKMVIVALDACRNSLRSSLLCHLDKEVVMHFVFLKNTVLQGYTSVVIVVVYSLRPTKTVRLAFKFYSTKIVHVDCSKVHLTKAISNTKKNNCIEKGMKPINCLFF